MPGLESPKAKFSEACQWNSQGQTNHQWRSGTIVGTFMGEHSYRTDTINFLQMSISTRRNNSMWTTRLLKTWSHTQKLPTSTRCQWNWCSYSSQRTEYSSARNRTNSENKKWMSGAALWLFKWLCWLKKNVCDMMDLCFMHYTACDVIVIKQIPGTKAWNLYVFIPALSTTDQTVITGPLAPFHLKILIIFSSYNVYVILLCCVSSSFSSPNFLVSGMMPCLKKWLIILFNGG